jgi:hypothetical protein
MIEWEGLEKYEPPEPDEGEKWDSWKARHPGKVPGSTVREGRRYRKPSGRHPRKGFIHGGKPERAKTQREECNELLDLIASLEAQIAAEGVE